MTVHDRLPVVEVRELPAKLVLDVEHPVEREARAYFYRRGEKLPVAMVKVSRPEQCRWEVALPKSMAKWKPGRYEVQIKTSAVDVAAAYELRLGTRLKLGDATVAYSCGSCCNV